MNVIKEKEIDILATPWGKCLGGLSCGGSMSYNHSEDDKVVPGGPNPTDYDEVVITKDTETIDAFSSCVILVKTETAHIGMGLNVMTQALHAKDGSLP